MFFAFGQNNSGGSFDFDEDAGITHWVVIEAKNADDANNKAQTIGLYFDGCSDGRDCSCCGDRRCPVDKHDEEPEPLIYGEPIPKAMDGGFRWMDPGKEVAIHYSDGRIVWF